jgi:hypothetical protein
MLDVTIRKHCRLSLLSNSSIKMMKFWRHQILLTSSQVTERRNSKRTWLISMSLSLNHVWIFTLYFASFYLFFIPMFIS